MRSIKIPQRLCENLAINGAQQRQQIRVDGENSRVPLLGQPDHVRIFGTPLVWTYANTKVRKILHCHIGHLLAYSPFHRLPFDSMLPYLPPMLRLPQ